MMASTTCRRSRNILAVIVDPNIPPPSGAIDTGKRPRAGQSHLWGRDNFQGGTHGSTCESSAETKPGCSGQPAASSAESVQPRGELFKAVRAKKVSFQLCRGGPLCQAMAIGIIAQRVNAAATRSGDQTDHKITKSRTNF